MAIQAIAAAVSINSATKFFIIFMFNVSDDYLVAIGVPNGEKVLVWLYFIIRCP